MDADIRDLKQALAACKRAVVLTGAGISTESGIPDFRSPGGIWERYTPVYFQEFLASAEARDRAWKLKFMMDESLEGAEPNRGHRAVAKLARDGTVSAVITQNVDGLHQAASADPIKVIELHGNTTYAACLDCGARHDLGPIKDAFLADGSQPRCKECGGLVKAATISFGQSLPEDALRDAERETLSCDLFLAIGSSLVVHPAASFPVLAKRAGAKLVILNRDPTDLDSMADLVIHREIGPTLGEAAGVN